MTNLETSEKIERLIDANLNRLKEIMTVFGVNTVYHAAAYKHVPVVEHNVVEGVRNNVFGTYYAARAACFTG